MATGQTIWLLASGGQDGVAALGDTVEAGSNAASIVGHITFSGVKVYTTYEEWLSDANLHCVPADSVYAFQPGEAKCNNPHKQRDATAHTSAVCVCSNVGFTLCAGSTTEVYGWVVAAHKRLPKAQPLPAMTRIQRSLFSLQSSPDAD